MHEQTIPGLPSSRGRRGVEASLGLGEGRSGIDCLRMRRIQFRILSSLRCSKRTEINGTCTRTCTCTHVRDIDMIHTLILVHIHTYIYHTDKIFVDGVNVVIVLTSTSPNYTLLSILQLSPVFVDTSSLLRLLYYHNSNVTQTGKQYLNLYPTY